MKILVTGATGFLGRTIVGEFLGEGFEVISTGKSTGSDLPYYIPADISRSIENLESLKNIETIIHAAGLAHQFTCASREDFRRVNVAGTKNIADLALRLKARNFILISSVAVYGRALFENLSFEEDAVCKPFGDYAESKFAAETAAREILEGKMNLTILRPSTIVGEGDRGNVARLISAVDQKKFIWLGAGRNFKSLVYKKDVARACAAARKTVSERDFRIFNVTADAVSMREIVGVIEKTLKKHVPGFKIPPAPLRYGLKIGAKLGLQRIEKLKETVEKWLSDDVFSVAKIACELNFKIETDALEGIRRETHFYKNSCRPK